jgi:ariadne-1
MTTETAASMKVTILPYPKEFDVDVVVDIDMDQDLGLSLVLEEKNARRAHEVEYQRHSISDIRTTQETQIGNVAAVCFIEPSQAAILLRHHRWNKEKVIEAYMDDPERTLKKAGIVNDDSGEHRIQYIEGFECEICFDEDDSKQSYALQCGHRACTTCWGTYLSKKIKEEGESSKVQCLFDKCRVVVDEKTVELLVDPETFVRYLPPPHFLLSVTYLQIRDVTESSVRRR